MVGRGGQWWSLEGKRITTIRKDFWSIACPMVTLMVILMETPMVILKVTLILTLTMFPMVTLMATLTPPAIHLGWVTTPTTLGC